LFQNYSEEVNIVPDEAEVEHAAERIAEIVSSSTAERPQKWYEYIKRFFQIQRNKPRLSDTTLKKSQNYAEFILKIKNIAIDQFVLRLTGLKESQIEFYEYYKRYTPGYLRRLVQIENPDDTLVSPSKIIDQIRNIQLDVIDDLRFARVAQGYIDLISTISVNFGLIEQATTSRKERLEYWIHYDELQNQAINLYKEDQAKLIHKLQSDIAIRKIREGIIRYPEQLPEQQLEDDPGIQHAFELFRKEQLRKIEEFDDRVCTVGDKVHLLDFICVGYPPVNTSELDYKTNAPLKGRLRFAQSLFPCDEPINQFSLVADVTNQSKNEFILFNYADKDEFVFTKGVRDAMKHINIQNSIKDIQKPEWLSTYASKRRQQFTLQVIFKNPFYTRPNAHKFLEFSKRYFGGKCLFLYLYQKYPDCFRQAEETFFPGIRAQNARREEISNFQDHLIQSLVLQNRDPYFSSSEIDQTPILRADRKEELHAIAHVLYNFEAFVGILLTFMSCIFRQFFRDLRNVHAQGFYLHQFDDSYYYYEELLSSDETCLVHIRNQNFSLPKNPNLYQFYFLNFRQARVRTPQNQPDQQQRRTKQDHPMIQELDKSMSPFFDKLLTNNFIRKYIWETSAIRYATNLEAPRKKFISEFLFHYNNFICSLYDLAELTCDQIQSID
jgi:hypothetical protein